MFLEADVNAFKFYKLYKIFNNMKENAVDKDHDWPMFFR